ncbi:MAG: ASCH domain-containing protein [Gammaproteobacteria bacterium]|nr:ASCH domain-containing protein [Gammaproteobacteria bacterium]
MQFSSPKELASAYFRSIGAPARAIPAYYFCDNQKDADECADLVLSGDKRATASSLWFYEAENEPLPKAGDLSIVTNWQGTPLCVIQVEKVEIVPFNKVTAEFALCEGEGDKSLEYWRRVHWDYYHRELAATSKSPTDDMPIVCEYFKVIFTA